ncbi:MAG: sugar ABC transporter substrate-binding protein [Thermomicrobiales bacterium]
MARGMRRREFLRFVAAGSGGMALAGLLAACGGSPTATSAPSAAPSRAPSAAPSVAPSAAPSSAAAASAAPASAASSAAAAATPTRPAAPSAAATPSAAPATPAASGNVVFFVTGDLAEKEAYQTIVNAFNGRQTRIKVELQHVPSADDYTKRLTADFAAGTPADVILLNYRRFGAYAAKGAFDPVGPYLAQSSVLKQTDFYPELIAPFSRNGVLVGIPQNASSLVIYYNKDMFTKAGVAFPKAGWTWDDFLTSAQALTKGTEQYGVTIAAQMIRVAPFIWQNGGDIVDNLAKPTKLTFDRPESLEAAQWFIDLQVKHKVAPDAVQQAAEADEARFLNGRAAMFFESRRFTPTLREQKLFDFDVAALPQRKVRASILHSDAYLLTSASKNKAAAFAFMEYANGPDGQPVIAATGRTVPSIKAVAETATFLNPTEKPLNNRAFIEAIPLIRPTINIDTTEQIESIVNTELRRAFLGQAPLADAISQMNSRTAELFKPQ